MSNKKKIKVIEVIPDDLPSYFVSGFFGGLTETEGIIKLYQDDLIPKIGENNQLVLSEVHKQFLTNLHLTPSAWKRMAYWMLKHVKEHETRHGEIMIKHLISKESNTKVDYQFV